MRGRWRGYVVSQPYVVLNGASARDKFRFKNALKRKQRRNAAFDSWLQKYHGKGNEGGEDGEKG